MINAKKISNLLHTTLIIGDPDKVVYQISKIVPGKIGTLSFCKYEDERAKKLIVKSKSAIIICSEQLNLGDLNFGKKTLILVSQPRLDFKKVVNEFFPWRNITPGVHPTAIISPSAFIHPSASIGPHCAISNAKIGKNVIIEANTVVGAEGFGYEADDDGTLMQFPHFGNVIIKDNVEIGANVCIDRGALSDTIIGKGTKIDNLVHIAHNVEIGKNCQIICQVGIGGSVKIGADSYIGIGAVIRNQIKIGKKVMVGMGAVVVKDVPDNMTVIGNPARPIPK